MIHIFDQYCASSDKVAFITFNALIRIVFNLTPKGRNTSLLRRSILSQGDPHGGRAFNDAIYAATKEF